MLRCSLLSHFKVRVADPGCLYVYCCYMQSGNVSGLVRRLLLLEAVQQPTSWSLLSPGLYSAWQQQQHLDLARATDSSSDSSSDSGHRGICNAWVPQLLRALLQPEADIVLGDCTSLLADLVNREKAERLTGRVQRLKQRNREATDTAAAADADAAADMLSHCSYALAGLRDAACRASLTCWVLTWHGWLQQQGGDYHRAAQR
jgi:hypothetical protein